MLLLFVVAVDDLNEPFSNNFYESFVVVAVVVVLLLLCCVDAVIVGFPKKTWHALAVIANFEKYFFSFFGDYSINGNTSFEAQCCKNTSFYKPINGTFGFFLTISNG